MFSIHKENMKHYMYMDDLKIITMNKKELETLIEIAKMFIQYRGMEYMSHYILLMTHKFIIFIMKSND